MRNFLREQLVFAVKNTYGVPDAIAGVATGAIAIGVLVAQELGVPFVYVRPEPKKHGRQNQIEGVIEKGKKVVVIEDLISTGKSSLNAVEALKNASVEVLGMIAIFSYGFEVADDNFKSADVTLHTLSDYHHLLEKAVEMKYINEKDLETLQEWRKNPSEWGI
ncbi:MAG: orotate phosphoribosyltransferase [Bacteroidetes bacterium]|nr:MAG: orotate phosphoribosyltransferase [Bacteroidota bacterium]